MNIYLENIKVTHLGEDYGTVAIAGQEYEVSLGFANSLKAQLKLAKKLDKERSDARVKNNG